MTSLVHMSSKIHGRAPAHLVIRAERCKQHQRIVESCLHQVLCPQYRFTSMYDPCAMDFPETILFTAECLEFCGAVRDEILFYHQIVQILAASIDISCSNSRLARKLRQRKP